VLSFHATKVFNTFEGGAIVCRDAKMKQHIDSLKNFGFMDETTVIDAGINGKMSELNAAIGLLQLKRIDENIKKRRLIDQHYREKLSIVEGIHCLGTAGELVANFAYFPILVRPNFRMGRDAVFQVLRDHGIYARRYFFPLISEFPMYQNISSAKRENLPLAFEAAGQVICLPIYPELELAEVDRITSIISG
jgi:dTDP-4-amino-4,6-dideoxygalactose transaminase